MAALLRSMLAFKVLRGTEVMKCLKHFFFESVKDETEEISDPPMLPKQQLFPRR